MQGLNTVQPRLARSPSCRPYADFVRAVPPEPRQLPARRKPRQSRELKTPKRERELTRIREYVQMQMEREAALFMDG